MTADQRFLTPDEAGKLNAQEEAMIAEFRTRINNLFLEEYVPGMTPKMTIEVPDNTPRRVIFNVCKGLQAAGWEAESILDASRKPQLTIRLRSAGPSIPLIVDKRSK